MFFLPGSLGDWLRRIFSSNLQQEFLLREDRDRLRELTAMVYGIQRDINALKFLLRPRLNRIRIGFTASNIGNSASPIITSTPSQGDSTMSTVPTTPTPGPITLSVGQTAIATVLGFDQFGNPWTGAIPPVTYSLDNTTVVQSVPNADNLTAVETALAAGTANLTATLTTAEGVSLTDTQAITVQEVTPPAPVLSSIKLAFSQQS